MSKDKEWQGVQLLSFDLQTVEFAYTSVKSFAAHIFAVVDISIGLHREDYL